METHELLFVPNLRFNVVDSVWRFYFQGDGLSSKSLDEDLHADDANLKEEGFKVQNEEHTRESEATLVKYQ